MSEHCVRSKKQLVELRNNREMYKERDGRLICPVCRERSVHNIIQRRWDYWECRTCGFNEDIDKWDIAKNMLHNVKIKNGRFRYKKLKNKNGKRDIQ